jgi:protease II
MIFCSFTNAEKQAVLKYSLKTKRWSSVIPLFVGEVSIAGGIDAFTVGYPNRPDVVINEEKAVIFKGTGPQYDLESGTEPVPWFAVHPRQKARGIVIVGYGSYGMMTKKYQVRLWQPWLARGYMIATLCVRGGGEVGDEWWEAGRGPANLHNRVDDFVAGVKALQSRYSFDRTNTVIYGRSAGGFLVTAASYHLMDKIGAVYAAKPYTDLLRTTTNAEAGQTLQESDEFGYVEDDPVGFRHNFEISPYENAPEAPKINPGVLVTGGTNDSEVPLSHPVRYSKRLNKIGWKNVLCRVEEGEGHFTELSGESAEADDAAIIESFLEQSR